MLNIIDVILINADALFMKPPYRYQRPVFANDKLAFAHLTM